MKSFLLLLALVPAALAAKALDSSYTLPPVLADWVSQTKTFEKAGRAVTSYAIYSPNRTHVITIGFVTGYTDREITKDHFDALTDSFAKAGLTEVVEKKRVTLYGMPGAQVIARGVVQGKEFKGKGVILKNDETELTILTLAVGIDLEDRDFAVALSGLGLAAK